MLGNAKKGSVWGGTKAAVWGLCILALVFGFALAGCSTDSDDGGGGGGGLTTPEEIRGTWTREDSPNYFVYIIEEKGAKNGYSRSNLEAAIADANASDTYDYKEAIGKYHKFGDSSHYYVYLDDAALKALSYSEDWTEAELDENADNFGTFTKYTE